MNHPIISLSFLYGRKETLRPVEGLLIMDWWMSVVICGHVRWKSRSLEKFINPVLFCPSCHLFSLLSFLFCPFSISCYLSTDLKKHFYDFFNDNLECFIANSFLKFILSKPEKRATSILETILRGWWQVWPSLSIISLSLIFKFVSPMMSPKNLVTDLQKFHLCQKMYFRLWNCKRKLCREMNYLSNELYKIKW